ncbi:MAG: hypothetical protein JWO33_323 [Caulobacteraceae bacterium]|nr:hypothetical protein [Caulobacteraceae bacterium]
MRTSVRAVGLALILTAAAGASHAAEAYGLKAARAAMSGKSQAVIVAVPANFVRADKATSSAEAVAAGDWGFSLGDWLKSRHDVTNVVIVTPEELRQLVKAPSLAKTCTTLFVRDRGHGLVYDDGCAPQMATYQAGDAWLRTGAAPAPASGFRTVELTLR